jgi:hypothetical protein
MPSQNCINNEIEDNDFSVNRATAGTAVEASIAHSDNTNTGSHARIEAQVGGTSGGDPYLYLNVPSGQDYSFGIDNTDSDALKIQDDVDPSTGNTLWEMTSAGERTMPLQPAFLAQPTAQNNVTGDATVYTVTFNTEIYDQNNDFDAVSTFTASVTGKYNLFFMSGTAGYDGTQTGTDAWIATSNRSYINGVNPINNLGPGNVLCQLVNETGDMDAADTATCVLQSTGGNKTVDLSVSTRCYFGGVLIV